MRTLVLLTALAISQVSIGAINAEWKQLNTRKNVEVFRGDVPASPVVAFKGTGIVNANIVKVLSVIRDDKMKPQWISDLRETYVLEDKSVTEKIEYNRTKTPWPLSDRDFVYHAIVSVDLKKGEVEVSLKSTTHPKAPVKKDVVRGELYGSRYFLRSIDGGKKTYLEVEILADPKGRIPKWIVNIFQKVWPSNTLDNIRQIAENPSYKVLPDVAAYAVKLRKQTAGGVVR